MAATAATRLTVKSQRALADGHVPSASPYSPLIQPLLAGCRVEILGQLLALAAAGSRCFGRCLCRRRAGRCNQPLLPVERLPLLAAEPIAQLQSKTRSPRSIPPAGCAPLPASSGWQHSWLAKRALHGCKSYIGAWQYSEQRREGPKRTFHSLQSRDMCVAPAVAASFCRQCQVPTVQCRKDLDRMDGVKWLPAVGATLGFLRSHLLALCGSVHRSCTAVHTLRSQAAV